MTLNNISLIITVIKCVIATIDLNSAELQYLADHLTQEECRELISAVHFESYEKPNALDHAERKISKDLTCIELLHHWNSAPNEGKGETHEALEHRLRQIGKDELADWLGRTVFHELALDLNRSLEKGLKELVFDTTTQNLSYGPTFIPVVQNSNPTEYSVVDNLLYALIMGLVLTGVGLIVMVVVVKLKKCLRNRKLKKRMKKYEVIEDSSGSSGSEDRFDLREYLRSDSRN